MKSNRLVQRVQDIDWTGFVLAGQGVYGSVYLRPSGRTAIKVGRITRNEVLARQYLSERGLSPKVFAYFPSVDSSLIPEEYRGRRRGPDVLIMERVKPAEQALKLRSPFVLPPEAVPMIQGINKLPMIVWGDNHNGNWGFLRGKPVVFDGLEWLGKE